MVDDVALGLQIGNLDKIHVWNKDAVKELMDTVPANSLQVWKLD